MRQLLTIILLSWSVGITAQTSYTLEDAMSAALAKNHGIQLSKKQVEMVANVATKGNAGMFPKVDLTGGGNYGNSNASLEFAGNTPPLEDISSQSLGYNAGVGFSYNIFDGMGMFHTYDKLKSQFELSEVQSRLVIESTLLQVSTIYYQAANLQQQAAIALETIDVSIERNERIAAKIEYGAGSRLELLNAKVDLNNDSTQWMNVSNALNSMKRNLNFLTGNDMGIDYVLSNDIELDSAFAPDQVESKTQANNLNLLLAKSNISLSEIDKKIQQSFMMPRAIIGANYGYNYSESNASLILSQSSLGLSANVSLAWNLFDGGRKKSALQNAQLKIESSQIEMQQAEQSVNRDMLIALDQYQNSFQIWKLQSRSEATAQLNFERSKALFYQGQLTTLQFREAQMNLSRVKSQVISAKYTIKLAEVELKRLSGELINGT